MEGTLWITKFQPLHLGQGRLSQDQAAENSIQSGFEHLQECPEKLWTLQIVPVSHHFHS